MVVNKNNTKGIENLKGRFAVAIAAGMFVANVPTIALAGGVSSLKNETAKQAVLYAEQGMNKAEIATKLFGSKNSRIYKVAGSYRETGVQTASNLYIETTLSSKEIRKKLVNKDSVEKLITMTDYNKIPSVDLSFNIVKKSDFNKDKYPKISEGEYFRFINLKQINKKGSGKNAIEKLQKQGVDYFIRSNDQDYVVKNDGKLSIKKISSKNIQRLCDEVVASGLNYGKTKEQVDIQIYIEDLLGDKKHPSGKSYDSMYNVEYGDGYEFFKNDEPNDKQRIALRNLGVSFNTNDTEGITNSIKDIIKYNK